MIEKLPADLKLSMLVMSQYLLSTLREMPPSETHASWKNIQIRISIGMIKENFINAIRRNDLEYVQEKLQEFPILAHDIEYSLSILSKKIKDCEIAINSVQEKNKRNNESIKINLSRHTQCARDYYR